MAPLYRRRQVDSSHSETYSLKKDWTSYATGNGGWMLRGICNKY